MILTVEGLSGAGKSTLKQRLSEHYGLTSYTGYGFRKREDQKRAVMIDDTFRNDRITRNIERLLIARRGMLEWQDNIIVDLFLERAVFVDQHEADGFVQYLMYQSPFMPSLSLVILVDHETRMRRLMDREFRALGKILPEFPNEDELHRQSWEYLSKALPYPVRFIDGNLSAQAVFESAVSIIGGI